MIALQIRRTLAAALGALVLVLGLPASGQARPAPEEYAGINIQKLIFGFAPTSWFGHFNAMERAGIQLVRFDALWQRIEPNPPQDGEHVYHWDRFDPIIGELAKRGIRWLPAVEYATKWSATSTAHYAAPPRDPAVYGEFAGAVARRYGANGSYWRENPEIPALPVTDYEIWNAPNNAAHYYPRPDPAHYADMFLAAREAIRAADPGADVWVGGLAGVDAADFVRRMFAARPALHGKVDAVAIHPYAFDADAATRMIVELRNTLDRLGEARAGIPVTEVGWHTVGDGPGRRISDGQRAGYLAALTERLARSDCGVWTFMPHTWSTKEQNTLSGGEWYGLWSPADATPNASGRAYEATVRRFARARSADLPLCDRPLGVEASSSSRASTRVVRRRSSRTGRSARVRRRYRRSCNEATVTVSSAPLPGATVKFRYYERRGRKRRWRTVMRTTEENGVAYVCRSRPAGRRAGRPLHLRRVTASHPDLVHGAVTVSRLRLP
ncbi:MAG: hypothetical protein WD844_11980 [Thermoleophilaceae bacterium]